MRVRIRAAHPDDAASIAAIYNQGIEERQATFETRPRTAEELAAILAEPDLPPFLVAEDEGRVVGWARVVRYDSRECYAGVGEASLYVDREDRQRGAGRELLRGLAAAAERRGYWKLVGLLFPENHPSVALLDSEGYERVGVYSRHGRLEGRWRDVLVVERLLGAAAK
jgi:L-amino acid N-acyltransferase YncA